MGELLARAALGGAVENVRVNVASMSDAAVGAEVAAEADRLNAL